jgi:hypothetical protein
MNWIRWLRNDNIVSSSVHLLICSPTVLIAFIYIVLSAVEVMFQACIRKTYDTNLGRIIMPLASVSKVRSLLRNWHPAALCADPMYRISPKSDSKWGHYGRNSFMPLNKVWLSLPRFSRKSHSVHFCRWFSYRGLPYGMKSVETKWQNFIYTLR